jgi:hypothetical protein
MRKFRKFWEFREYMLGFGFKFEMFSSIFLCFRFFLAFFASSSQRSASFYAACVCLMRLHLLPLDCLINKRRIYVKS